MKKLLIVLVLLFSLISCGNHDTGIRTTPVVDVSLQELVTEFEGYGFDLSGISFKETDQFGENILGVCRKEGDNRTVFIQPKAIVGEIEIRLTFLHEIIHCSRGFWSHESKANYDDGCSIFVMSTHVKSYEVSKACWKKHKSEYLAQYYWY